LNDGSSTFLSSSGTSNLCIDLTISSRDLGPLISVSTFSDLHGSDHYV